jgi:hypothetical protein
MIAAKVEVESPRFGLGSVLLLAALSISIWKNSGRFQKLVLTARRKTERALG